MTKNIKININWEIEIPKFNFLKLYGRGAFAVINSDELVLTANENDQDKVQEEGKLLRIGQSSVDILFETDSMLWAPVLNNKEIYLVTSRVSYGDSEKKGIIFKLGSDGNLEWQFKLDGSAASLPVIWKDSIFVTDFVRPRRGNIYRFNKKGKLIFKKPLRGFNSFEPWILQGQARIIVSFFKTLEILDFNGESLKTKDVTDLGEILFSENIEGQLFAAINNSIAALSQNLDILWEYRPMKGFASMAPVFDSAGNLYSLLSNRTLISLDCNGVERWMVQLPGFGYQPCIFNDDNIIAVTSEPSGKGAKEEQFITYINVYSNLGNKIAYYELPGYAFHTVKFRDDSFFVGTNCIRINTEKESHINSIKVFSLTLS